MFSEAIAAILPCQDDLREKLRLKPEFVHAATKDKKKGGNENYFLTAAIADIASPGNAHVVSRVNQ